MSLHEAKTNSYGSSSLSASQSTPTLILLTPPVPLRKEDPTLQNSCRAVTRGTHTALSTKPLEKSLHF